MEKEQLILHSAQEFNILPLTSYCDARCIFCSHRYNPPDVQVLRTPPRTIEEVERTLAFLDADRNITIGESATKIIEGEPFSHPQIFEILKLVRKEFPKTLISLTTNGHRIDAEAVQSLKMAAPAEINISLNSAAVKGRNILMGDDRDKAEKAINSVRLLQSGGIPFHGSIVAMPHQVGWPDLGETIIFLGKHGALTIRVFMAGFAQNAPSHLKFPREMHQQLADFINRVGEKVSCPLLLEPPKLDNLVPITAGVIKGSRADQAGVKKGDVILSISGRTPRSRVEAWHYAQKRGNVTLRVKRDDGIREFTWINKKNGEKAGLVMEYDFDMNRLEEIKRSMENYQGVILFLCSELGERVLQTAWDSLGRNDVKVAFQPVKNNLFGGSIGAAGLLTVDDFHSAYTQYKNEKGAPELVLVPREAFDYRGNDLVGKPFEELTEKIGVKVKIG